MSRIFFAGAFAALALVACGNDKPAASPAAATGAPSSAPAATTAAAEGMKQCTCTAAPTEACHPNCAPITWQSADCDSANGRPKACAEAATH